MVVAWLSLSWCPWLGMAGMVVLIACFLLRVLKSGWEEFNRRMDEQDKAVAAAVAAAKARGKSIGGGAAGSPGTAAATATRGDLPPAMVEVLKVSLSVLRRLASRNLATSVTGPFSTGMAIWPSGHPQVVARSRQRGGKGAVSALARRFFAAHTGVQIGTNWTWDGVHLKSKTARRSRFFRFEVLYS